MLHAAIVPEGDGVLAPAEAALEQLVLRMIPQIVQDGGAFVARYSDDALGEPAVDVERFLACD